MIHEELKERREMKEMQGNKRGGGGENEKINKEKVRKIMYEEMGVKK